MTHTHAPISKPLILPVAVLIAFSLATVGAAQLFGVGKQKSAESTVVESVTVVFTDEADGGVGVYDHPSGAAIRVFDPETGGFVRTAMRAVAHERKISGGGPGEPFTLARTLEGRLLLIDTVTGRTVSLEAFGDANASEFAALLPSSGRRG